MGKVVSSGRSYRGTCSKQSEILEFLLQFYDYIEQDLKEGVKIERKSQLVYNNCVMEPVEEDKSIAAEVHPVRRASLFYHNF